MLRFRRALVGDIPEIMRIERLEGYDALVARSTEAQHAARLVKEDAAVWLAEADGGVAGFSITDALDDPHGGAYLRRIAVATRGAGYGRDLLAHTMRFAFDEHATPRFWLDVLADNARARKVYNDAGLREEGVMRGSYLMPGGARADRVVMAMLAEEWARRASS